jgi:hypothetical protein
MFPIPRNNEGRVSGPRADIRDSSNCPRDIAKRDGANRSLLQRSRRLMGEMLHAININTTGALLF